MRTEITVRPLKRGEESLWVSLGVEETEKDARREKLVRYLSKNGNLPPENYLLAFAKGRLVAKLSGVSEATGYVAIKMHLAQGAPNEAASSLFDYVRPKGPLQALSWSDREEDREWRSILKQEGFRVLQDKAYFRKALSEYRLVLADPFTYRSMAEIGIEDMLTIHSQTYAGNLNRNFVAPDADFESHQESAGSLFSPHNWYAAYLHGKAAGIVLPQRFPDSPGQGTLMSVGITNEFRRRGLGRILQAKGMELLKRQGARDYVGSTDVQNLPMLRIFESNGCEKIGTRTTHLDSTP